MSISPVESVSAILKISFNYCYSSTLTDVSKAYTETDNKDGLLWANVLGTSGYCQRLRKKYSHYLIHISTDFIFNGANPPTTGYTELDQPSPN